MVLQKYNMRICGIPVLSSVNLQKQSLCSFVSLILGDPYRCANDNILWLSHYKWVAKVAYSFAPWLLIVGLSALFCLINPSLTFITHRKSAYCLYFQLARKHYGIYATFVASKSTHFKSTFDVNGFTSSSFEVAMNAIWVLDRCPCKKFNALC